MPAGEAQAILRAGERVARAVNSEMVLACWHIGREIVESAQGGQHRAEYGEAVLETLSAASPRFVELTLDAEGARFWSALYRAGRRFDIPEATVLAVREAHAHGHRVVAVGTTVTRALEGSAAQHDGELVAGSGVTDLRFRGVFQLRIADGIRTGIHDPSESHFDLLEAFAPSALLHAALAHAEESGYLCHELGDSALILG